MKKLRCLFMTAFVLFSCIRISFFQLRFCEVKTVAFLSTLVLKTLVGIFLDKYKAERFLHIRLETFLVVVDGCLASDDWFPFCRVALFFFDEKVKLINVLQGYIVKGLELAKAFKYLVGS